jgi:hypothetical protein
MDEVLTSQERQLVHDLGRWHTRAMAAIGDSPATGQRDRDELTAHVHALQHAIMAQAAARAFPAEFRLLGSVV